MCTYLGPEFDPQHWDYSKPVPYCGKPALPGKSYCEEHYPIVYNVGSALRKRHKDIRTARAVQDLQQMILDIAEELEDEGFEPGMEWREPESVEV